MILTVALKLIVTLFLDCFLPTGKFLGGFIKKCRQNFREGRSSQPLKSRDSRASTAGIQRNEACLRQRRERSFLLKKEGDYVCDASKCHQ